MKLMNVQKKLGWGDQCCASRTKSATEVLFSLESAELWLNLLKLFSVRKINLVDCTYHRWNKMIWPYFDRPLSDLDYCRLAKEWLLICHNLLRTYSGMSVYFFRNEFIPFWPSMGWKTWKGNINSHVLSGIKGVFITNGFLGSTIGCGSAR